MQQIQLEKTLDVEIVERELAELWQQTTSDPSHDVETAVLRARVANLLVFVSSQTFLDEVDGMIHELTTIHPSRVLMMLGDRPAADQDIEMFVAAYCQSDKRTGIKRLCCEEITLKARGSFVVELPSAALPLLVSDLSTFLWWRDAMQVADKVLDPLLKATDRLVIDSADFADPVSDLLETNKLFHQESYKHVGISDLNWARLTLWRALLADFYDVPAYRTWLKSIDHVRIDYVAPESEPATVAPQALLLAGWLASRLRWTLVNERPAQVKSETMSFKFLSNEPAHSQPKERPAGQPSRVETTDEGGERVIQVELNRVEREERKPGRLVHVELLSTLKQGGSFLVARSADNLHLVAEARLGQEVHRGRVLPVRNRSAAQLLSRELEILCNDQIYEEALAVATSLIDLSTPSPGGRN
jgi:glucose-6-phosphate dehydrogenase assembly protein OpcA